MQALRIVPTISTFDTFAGFAEEFAIGEDDLIVTNEWRYNKYIAPLGIKAHVMFREKYGTGEPSDEMIDAMARDMKQYVFSRIIAFGGGTIIDVSKVLALDVPERSVTLFTGETVPVKKKTLVVVPTTCGTGSEVTNVSIAELKSLGTKKGLACEETYPDFAVLTTEALTDLPDKVFATSSIDALIHACESYLSPKASPFTEMFSVKAIDMIISGYAEIIKRGGNTKENRAPYLADFLTASDYAGIAFGNAGCGAVHALSYSIGGAFHVAHGEANYQFFTEVFKTYMRKAPDGKIAVLNSVIAGALGCGTDEVYDRLDECLSNLVSKKPLREYGMTEEQIDTFTQSTVQNQQRLLGNNYVYLSDAEIREIFANLY